MGLKNSGTLVPRPSTRRFARFYHPPPCFLYFFLLLLDIADPVPLIMDERETLKAGRMEINVISISNNDRGEGRANKTAIEEVGKRGVFYSAGRRGTSIGTERPSVDGLKAVRRPRPICPTLASIGRDRS